MCLIYDCCFDRSRLEKAKKEQEDRLEYVKEQLDICTHDAKRRIKEITTKVEGQVSHARHIVTNLFIFVTMVMVCRLLGD